MPTILGSIFPVKNKNPEATANDTYYSVWVNYNGQPTPLLFTELELDIALDRAEKNMDDVKGSISKPRLLDQR